MTDGQSSLSQQAASVVEAVIQKPQTFVATWVLPPISYLDDTWRGWQKGIAGTSKVLGIAFLGLYTYLHWSVVYKVFETLYRETLQRVAEAETLTQVALVVGGAVFTFMQYGLPRIRKTLEKRRDGVTVDA
jgi:hypothetical protein